MIQEDLVTLLGPLVPNGDGSKRVYGSIGKQGTLMPYIVYQRVISQVENILDGNGNPPINNTRMQIDVWSNSYADAQATAAAVRVAMLGWATKNLNNGEQDFYEQDTRLHRVMMDYSIWHYN